MTLSRRELLKRGAAGGAALALGPIAIGCGSDAEDSGPRVVIVGAGLAGLSCAYRLKGHGIASAIYEANPDRIGGRCWTAREFAGGQTAEHGGEFIDTRHRRMRAFAKQFGFELTDLYAVPNPGHPRLWLNGARRYPGGVPGATIFQRRIEAAAQRVGSYGYADATPAARAFDELSVAEWLDANIPGGSASLQGQWVWADMMSEFGLDADRLSALNLFYEYVENTPGADERYHVLGGNDQIPHALAGGAPRRDDPAWRRPRGPLRARRRELRHAVRGRRRRCLRRPRRPRASVHDVAAGRPHQGRAEPRSGGPASMSSGWARMRRSSCSSSGARSPTGGGTGTPRATRPSSRHGRARSASPARGSVVTTYFGGRSGAEGLAAREAHAPTLPVEVRRNLASLTRGGAMGLTGLGAGFNGRAWTDRWESDPWVRGSYAAYLPGQYTRYYGYIGQPEGRDSLRRRAHRDGEPGLPGGRRGVRRARGGGDCDGAGLGAPDHFPVTRRSQVRRKPEPTQA